MKKRLGLLFTILLCSACHLKTANSPTNQQSNFEKFKKLDDSSIKIPEFTYQTWNLDNGLKVFFAHDDELPLVSSTLLIPGGSYWDLPGEKGLYDALGSNMRNGGAGNLSAAELDREIDKYAASVSSDFDQEYGSVSATSLSTDFEKIFSLMCDVLLKPKFDRERLSLWKGQSLEGIKRRADDPSTVASLAMRELLAGGTPYGAITKTQDVIAITRAKLRALHAKAITPNGAILAIAGNISEEQARTVVAKYLASWPKSNSPLAQLPEHPPQKSRGIVFIEQPLPQATILIGQLGPQRFTQDQYAIEVFNQFFGSGGFGSVLMKKIRTERGLAYGVYGSVNSGLKRGRALMHLQTKPESSGEAILESIRSLEEMRNKLVNADELSETKSGITNTFIFNFTSPAQVMSRKVQLELYGYPADYDSNYLNNIRSVNPTDLQQVANNRWNYDDFVIVLVGPRSAIESLKAVQNNLPAPLNLSSITEAKFDEALSR